MIRKQFYIDKLHEQKLKRLAGERGVTEAEIIREAIDRIEPSPLRTHRVPDPDAARELIESMREMARRPIQSAPGRRWTRDELYEERIGRWTKS